MTYVMKAKNDVVILHYWLFESDQLMQTYHSFNIFVKLIEIVDFGESHFALLGFSALLG